MSPSEKAKRLRLVKARHKVIQGRPVRSLIHVHQNEMRRKWAAARNPVELAPMRISVLCE